MNYEGEELSDADIKLVMAYLKFTEYYAEYIKQNNEDLHKRATDYAITYTNEDIPGINLTHIKDVKRELGDNEEN